MQSFNRANWSNSNRGSPQSSRGGGYSSRGRQSTPYRGRGGFSHFSAGRVQQNDEQSVDLISNCYCIQLGNSDLIASLFQYEVSLSLARLGTGGDDEKTLLPFIKRMTDPHKVPKELRKKVVQAAMAKWMTPSGDSEGRFLKCDLNCFKLIANFDLPTDVQLVDVPWSQGNLVEPTLLQFSVELKKIKFDDIRKLLNVLIGVDGLTNSDVLVHQLSTHTIRYNVEEYIRSVVFRGIRILRGQTVRIKSIALGSALTISNTTGLFYEPVGSSQRLLDYARLTMRIDDFHAPLSQQTVALLSKRLAGRQAEITHTKLFGMPRRLRIIGLSGTANDMIEDQAMSIREYFRVENGIELQYPNMPLVVFDKQGRRKIPLELCSLVNGDKVTREIYPNEQAEMTQKATLRPQEYFGRVEAHSKLLIAYNEAHLKKLNCSIDPRPLEVKGQVLLPVWLRGGTARWTIKPNNGQYDARKVEFLRPIEVSKFYVTLIGIAGDSLRVLDELRDHELNKFIQEYVNAGRAKGVKIDTRMAEVELIIDEEAHLLRDKLRQHVERLNQQCVDYSIMVIPDETDHVYEYIQFLETHFKFQGSSGRRTRLSCLRMENLRDMLRSPEIKNSAFLQNMWLKHNSELGGINYVLKSNGLLELPGPEFLVLGVDVCHPSRADKLSTSVATVVGLWSIAGDQYSHSVRLRAQPARHGQGDRSAMEQVVDIGLMVDGILSSYSRRMANKLPTKIMILRDGVSEGQFKMVETCELQKIRQILTARYSQIGQSEPLISCFIIQKRHDVRFKLSSPINRNGRDDYQMPSGTIVDTRIISPKGFSFYAAPHSSILGTARPPFVTKLVDEIRMTDRDYQRLILALCYLSPRCTKCTSIPTPVDLADLAAERGKFLAVELAKLRHAERGGDLIAITNAYFSGLGDEYLDTMFYV